MDRHKEWQPTPAPSPRPPGEMPPEPPREKKKSEEKERRGSMTIDKDGTEEDDNPFWDPFKKDDEM